MKTCIKCNISYGDDKKFCKKCGSPLVTEFNIEPKDLAKKTVFEDRLKADPLNIEILHEYAQFLFNNLLFQEAILISLKILAINDKDIIANELLFKSYIKTNRVKESIEIGEQLLTEKPEDIFLLENLANLLSELKNYDKALKYYDKVLTIQPANSSALHNKAKILLKNNCLEEAIVIFKRLKAEGQNDRLTIIYYGIDKALNSDYKTAKDILISVLSSKDVSLSDFDNNRGFLYLAYSLSISDADLSEINRWFSLIDFDVFKNNNHIFDEQTIVKTVIANIKNELGKIQSVNDNAKYRIDNLIYKYLDKTSFFFENKSNATIADIWYNIAIKQEEFNLYKEALSSCKKAIDIIPDENKYIDKYQEIKKLLDEQSNRNKRKIIILFVAILASILIVVFSIISYHKFKENKTWKLAKTTNSFSSFQDYLNTYPTGKYFEEALNMQEDALWNIILKINNAIAYDEYLSLFFNGKYKIEAQNALKKSKGYSLNFSTDHLKNGVKLVGISVGFGYTKVTIYIHNGGVLHEPGSNYAFEIIDKESNFIYHLKRASVNFNKLINPNSTVHLYFEKISFKVKNIDILEGNCSQGCWHMHDVYLIRNSVINNSVEFR